MAFTVSVPASLAQTLNAGRLTRGCGQIADYEAMKKSQAAKAGEEKSSRDKKKARGVAAGAAAEGAESTGGTVENESADAAGRGGRGAGRGVPKPKVKGKGKPVGRGGRG